MKKLHFILTILMVGAVLGCPPEENRGGSVTQSLQSPYTQTRYETDAKLHLIVGNEPSIRVIGGYAYTSDKTKLTKLSFDAPSSVAIISNSAFRQNALTALELPDSITTIELLAFADNALTSLSLPNSVTTIGEAAFGNNKIQSLTLPASVTSIGSRAFANNRLTSLTLPATLTTASSVAKEAFITNNNLTVVTLSKALYQNLENITVNTGDKMKNGLVDRFGEQVETYQDCGGNQLNKQGENIIN